MPDLAVLARYAAVVEDDVVLRIAADRQRLGADRDLAAIAPVVERERRLRRARFLAEKLLAVEHHRVPGGDGAERLAVGRHLLPGRVDERTRHAQIPGRAVLVALHLDRRESAAR